MGKMGNTSFSNWQKAGTSPLNINIGWPTTGIGKFSVSSANFVSTCSSLSDIEDALDAPAIARGMADIAAGRTVTWEQVKSKLGL